MPMPPHPNVTLPEPLLSTVQEEAARQQKTLDEMASELIILGLSRKKDRITRLTALMDKGHRRAEEIHPGLDEQAVVNIIHQHRGR